MLAYPSIPSWRSSRIGEPCIGFYKYDGSNLRWEWTPKRGWYKFGTRTQLFDETATPYNQAIPMFKQQIGEAVVEQILSSQRKKVERIIAFTEFFGPSSFAGTHDEIEPKELILIDVSVYKQGFLPARKFVDLFGQYSWSPKIVYEGNMNYPFINAVRIGEYPVYEGVVCKGIDWNAKIKTNKYLERLKGKFGDDWQKYE